MGHVAGSSTAHAQVMIACGSRRRAGSGTLVRGPAKDFQFRTDTMIIDRQEDVTTAVLSELARAPDARFKEIMSAFVRHLHDFAREVRLTEEELRTAAGYVVQLGRHTNRDPQRGGADRGLARPLLARVPAQQRRQRPDRDRREPARSVLAHAFPGDAQRRVDRAIADTRAGAVREGLVQRHGRADPSPERKSTSGSRRRKASTRIRIRPRPT